MKKPYYNREEREIMINQSKTTKAKNIMIHFLIMKLGRDIFKKLEKYILTDIYAFIVKCNKKK